MNTSSQYDQSQSKFLSDPLILVSYEDEEKGSISKLDAHLKANNNQLPHRAFSVFLFNKENKLLIQKRSAKKLTFPLLWSNTCCSHPLDYPDQNRESTTVNACISRIKYELGLKTTAFMFKLFDKILYRAPSDNEKFEEFEVDYLYIAHVGEGKSSDFKGGFELEKWLNKEKMMEIINEDEVCDVEFMSIAEVLDAIKNRPEEFSPWFKIVMKMKGSDMSEYLAGNEEKLKYEKGVKNCLSGF